MAYDTDTFKRAIDQMSDDELLQRLHLNMFSDEARIAAEEEAVNRNLELDSSRIKQALSTDKNAIRKHRSRKYVNALTGLAGVAGASQLGIFGGLAFLLLGRWIANKLDSRLESFSTRFLGGVSILVVGIALAACIRLVLAAAID